MKSTLVLLMNIGSPESPQKKDVARYLSEFLTDPRIINLPFIFRHLLVRCLIVPFRASKSAHAYKSIWTQDGSPLVSLSQQLADKLHSALNHKPGDEPSHHFTVKAVMRYGTPNLRETLAILNNAKNSFHKVILLPLYPQYSAATTGSSLAQVYECFARTWDTMPPINALEPFYDDEEFIKISAKHMADSLNGSTYDHLLFSYHGLPEDHIHRSCPRSNHCQNKKDGSLSNPCNLDGNRPPLTCYKAQCQQFTTSVVKQMNLEHQRTSWSFQSRLGRKRWLSPYTIQIIHQLREQGVKNLAVYSPAFVTDCLETLEEIAISLKAAWHKIGGETFTYVPALNCEQAWVNYLKDMILKNNP